MYAVIMAGGKGTRLSSVTNDIIPKSMVRINGLPLLEYQIRILLLYGIKEIIIITGYLHERIESYFGNGEDWGVRIKYIIEDTPRGTGGSLFFLSEFIKEDFLLLFGDLIFDISIQRMIKFHKEKNALVTLFAHPNSHPYDSDLLILDTKNSVIGYCGKHDTRQGCFQNLVNAGLYIIHPDLFDLLPRQEIMDLEQDIIFPQCNRNNRVFAYISSEYVKDIGTPERLRDTENDIKAGIINSKNLDNSQKCIFFEYNSIVNPDHNLIYNADQLELEETAITAIKTINKSSYLAMVIINQLVGVKDLCSEKDVDNIHNKLETLLGEQGAYLDGILYYPHHLDKVYEGKTVNNNAACRCCKPDIDKFERRINYFNISLKNSFVISNSMFDFQNGYNSKTKTILVKTGHAGSNRKHHTKPSYVCNDISEAVNIIVSAWGE
jgi:NDP-sugar pyrophosphorylase family protein